MLPTDEKGKERMFKRERNKEPKLKRNTDRINKNKKDGRSFVLDYWSYIYKQHRVQMAIMITEIKQ